jgi:hypothetical protein
VGVANRRRVEASFWGACWAAALGYLGGRHMLIPWANLGTQARALSRKRKKKEAGLPLLLIFRLFASASAQSGLLRQAGT